MSLLWSGQNTKLSTNQTKPSPTYQNAFLGSARNWGIHRDDENSNRSVQHRSIEGSSLFASLVRKIAAGMTVEAAVVLPLFLFFFLNLGSAMEMIRFHGNLQLALWEVGGELAMYEYAVERGVQALRADQKDSMLQEKGQVEGESLQENPKENSWWEELAGIAITATYVKGRLVDELGEEYVEQSPVAGGAAGISLWESDIVGENGEIELVVTYRVEPLFGLVDFGSFRMANHYYARGWTGYEIPTAKQMVYVTENGEVYHVDSNCTHLKLSIREIYREALVSARNQYGAKYAPCEKCARGNMPGRLYIATEGDCYHFDKGCSGLKRTVREIGLEEAGKYRPCSRCSRTG